jgi:hypothetical protein
MPCTQSRVCGQVPVTNVSLLACYCEGCGGWTVYMSTFRQLGDEVEQQSYVPAMHFGPFDGLDAVVGTIGDELAALFTAPGRPWDPRQ